MVLYPTLEDVSPFFEPDALARVDPSPIAHTDAAKDHATTSLEIEKPASSQLRSSLKTPNKPSTSISSKITKKVIIDAPGTGSSPGSSLSESDLSDLSSESESESDMELLIPKPDGEAGRPGRGGYNLKDALAWDKDDYRRLKKNIKKLVSERLDSTKNFRSQNPASVIAVQQSVSQMFPSLRRYESCWPVTDLIRLELKYTSGRARRVTQKDESRSPKDKK